MYQLPLFPEMEREEEEEEEERIMVSEIVIDRGMPLIPVIIKGKRKYPFPLMEVGDSFLVACDRDRRKSIIVSVLGCARADRMKGKKFTCRKVENGVRCWRIE